MVTLMADWYLPTALATKLGTYPISFPICTAIAGVDYNNNDTNENDAREDPKQTDDIAHIIQH